MKDAAPLLRAAELTKHFVLKKSMSGKALRVLKAVDSVNLEIFPAQAVGLVGESGCGKSTLGRLLLKLQESTSGEIQFKGNRIEHYGYREMLPLRRHMQIIFQDPYNSLNPRKTVIDSVMDPLRTIPGTSKENREDQAAQILRRVGLDESRFYKYPHELSGGQRQRVVIARAVIVNPDFVVCDEPVSSLDVSIRAQILKLLKILQKERKMAYLFISHDLSVVRYLCDTVLVMYLGKIIETGSKDDIFNAPAHPYTQALISAIPAPEPPPKGNSSGNIGQRANRIILQGDVPSPINLPPGCRFRQCCPYSSGECAAEDPPLTAIDGSSHKTACYKTITAFKNSGGAVVRPEKYTI
jgi:peptide/nickel transport system ATP-binding protein/oligopeptide transport system ATP-binding protein